MDYKPIDVNELAKSIIEKSKNLAKLKEINIEAHNSLTPDRRKLSPGPGHTGICV